MTELRSAPVLKPSDLKPIVRKQTKEKTDEVESKSAQIDFLLSMIYQNSRDLKKYKMKKMQEPLPDLSESVLQPLDVQKEDLMKVQKPEKKGDEDQVLPQMIREYILHDRGNSIFLSESFANLPSPVNEGKTIKNLFKFNEDEDNVKKLERENREKNEIKIEGKQEKPQPKKSADSKHANLKLFNQKDFIKEIDKIVFESPEVPPNQRKSLRNQKQKSQFNQKNSPAPPKDKNSGKTSKRDEPAEDPRSNYRNIIDPKELIRDDPYQDLEETNLYKQMEQIDTSIDNSFSSHHGYSSFIPADPYLAVNKSVN